VGIHSGVKLKALVFLMGVASWPGGGVHAQEEPPPLRPLPAIPSEAAENSPARASVAPADVVASAVEAVARLGDEVVLGRYQVAVERMNPQWKDRTAKRMGGMKELENQLAGVARQMVQQGISMISFKPQGQPRSFEVGPGKELQTVNGVQVENLVFNKWLVLIPTVTKFRIIREGQPKPLVIESIGFQAAISEKSKIDWTFIDGSGLSVNDLRSLFVTLPRDLELPPLEKREVR
jgi:hypothetical protein